MKPAILYVNKIEKNKTGKTNPHSHSFWQLEVVTNGSITSIVEGKTIKLNSGDMLLLKPGVKHEFTYDAPGISWLSFKFHLDKDPATPYCIIRHSVYTLRLIETLKILVQKTILEDYEAKSVEGIIHSLLHYIKSGDFNREHNSENSLIKKILTYVKQQNGRKVTINELAEKLSYTRSYLSKEFKKQTGTRLKSYIDAYRVKKIKDMLAYSDFTVSEIATFLDFKDIFSLSRFFKHNTGVCPRDYRNNYIDSFQ